MVDAQVRYRLPEDVIAAVNAAAKLERVHPSTIIERALRSYFGPQELLREGGKSAKHMAEIRDLLNVIAEHVGDHAAVIDDGIDRNECFNIAAQ